MKFRSRRIDLLLLVTAVTVRTVLIVGYYGYH